MESARIPVLEGMRGSPLRETPKNREDEIRLSLMGLAALFSYLGCRQNDKLVLWNC